MAASKLLLVSILASLILAIARGDAGIAAADELSSPAAPAKAAAAAAADDSGSPLSLEVEKLRSRISTLESSILERAKELKSKDEAVARLESVIEEKSASIASLETEIAAIQKKGAVNAEELVGGAHVRASELEKQVEKLKDEAKTQNKKRGALETRANEAEEKLKELNLKLETLSKTNDEQKQIIRKTERALKVAEEELMRAQLEATSKVKELTEIHGAWLPPWFATHISYCQDLAATHWNERAKPAFDAFLQKAYEKSSQAQKLVEPHVVTAKTKWIPAAKEQIVIFLRSLEPHFQLVSTKTIEFYEASKSASAPHIAKVQELTVPYFQEAKRFSKPYVDQVAIATKPHVDKVRLALKPYTKHVVRSYKKVLKSTSVYHHQVQATVMEKLKNHELTKPLATKEFVWFVASALLAFPILFLYRLLSALFCKKTRKPARNANANHASRKHKRRHADK